MLPPSPGTANEVTTLGRTQPETHDHEPHEPTESEDGHAHGEADHAAHDDHAAHADPDDHNDAAHADPDDHDDADHPHARGLRGLVASILRPHSHDAADSVDSALAASREGMRTLKLSLVVLAVTATIQLGIFAASGSVALLADTIHNFADALTAVPLAAAFWLGRRPATQRYTYGYGRSEDLAGVFIVLTVAASSALAAFEAVHRLLHPHHVHQVGWVIGAGVVGFLGNEAVAHYRIRVGRRIGSAALEADGRHARTDGFTSLAVVIGAIGVAIGWQLADPIVGLVITLAILVVVKNAARDIYRRLMDAVEPSLVETAIATLGAVDGVEAVEVVRLRWVGHELHAEAELISDGALTLSQAHEVAEHAEHDLLHTIPRLTRANIHIGPPAHGGTDPHSITAHHRTPGSEGR